MENSDREAPEADIGQAKVLVRGTFRPDDVKTVLVDKIFTPPPELEGKIDNVWKEKEHLGWFNGKVLRLDSYGIENRKLNLVFSVADFKNYIGTRDFETLRKYGVENIANPFGASSVIFTSDNKMVIGLRKFGDAVGSVDAIGGYLDPRVDLDLDNNVDIFKAAKRELSEEIGIKHEELFDGVLLGITYEYAGICHPSANFSFKTNLTSDDILNRKQEEISAIVVDPEKVPHDKDQNFVIDVLKSHYPNIEPDGRVTIALARKHQKGVNYKKEVLRSADQI